MSAQHTPGPWQIDSEDGQWWIYGGGDERATIGIAKCDLIVNAVSGICKQQNPINGGIDNDEKLANAALIAAAPDLLAAVESIDWGHENNKHGPTLKEWLVFRDKALAAIAKARGRL
jgi:hypothetical protein